MFENFKTFSDNSLNVILLYMVQLHFILTKIALVTETVLEIAVIKIIGIFVTLSEWNIILLSLSE